LKTLMGWVAGFVKRVVTGDPGVGFVVRCEMLPEPEGAVLKMFVVPELSLAVRLVFVLWEREGGTYDMVTDVRVPVAILPAGNSVQVDDGIDFMGGAKVNNTVEPFEPLRLEDAGVKVVFEMTVIDRDSDAVKAQLCVEFGVGVGEEVLEERVEEKRGLLGADSAGQGVTDLVFSAGKAGDKVLHVHPSS
jgi:hypothetical protein